MKGCSMLLTALSLLAFAAAADASTVPLADVRIAADAGSIRRGAETVVTVCMNCHSLKYIKFRDLLDVGVKRDSLDLWKGDKDLNAALIGSTPAEVARQVYGVVPPDLSLITAAREEGGRYVYSLLTGFYTDDSGNTDNHVFPGITMPDILGYTFASNAKDRHEIENNAGDVAAFLVWAADPDAGVRKKIGIAVIIYLVILTVLLYFWKKRIWKGLDKGGSV